MAKGRPKAPAVEVISTARPAQPKPTKRNGDYKVCSECNRSQRLENFYAHRLNRVQMYRDKWCKSCIQEKCYDEVTFRKYLYQNGRQWNPDMWVEALKTATRDMNLLVGFAKITDPEQQQKEIEKRAVACACAIMNKPAYYKFIDMSQVDGDIDIEKHVEAEKSAQRESNDPYYSLQLYSDKWRGTYTQYEIDTMDTYLDKIVQARGVEDEIAMDYAKKFVAQSSLVDRLAAAMRDNPSKENIEAHKGASGALEVISKAANIAPAYKKNDVTVGLGSLGVFIRAMENGDMLGQCPEFPPDQIDGLRKDFRHTIAAVEGAGGLWSEQTT